MKGQADDLGCRVFKKRLTKNMHRAIILAEKDCDNIEDDELAAFRQLARSYEKLTDQQIARLLHNKDLTEICHAGEEGKGNQGDKRNKAQI